MASLQHSSTFKAFSQGVVVFNPQLKLSWKAVGVPRIRQESKRWEIGCFQSNPSLSPSELLQLLSDVAFIFHKRVSHVTFLSERRLSPLQGRASHHPSLGRFSRIVSMETQIYVVAADSVSIKSTLELLSKDTSNQYSSSSISKCCFHRVGVLPTVRKYNKTKSYYLIP